MSGPVYHYSAGLESQRKLPAYYDDTLFIYEWSRNWIKEVKLDAAGNVLKINPFLPNMTFRRPMDMKIGPDGAIYMIEWGSGFGGGNTDSQLIRIDYKAPTTTIGLTATAVSPNRVRLTWTDVWTNETGIRVERSTDGTNFATLVDLPANTTSYEDAGLQSFVTYSYRVRALFGQTPTSPSDVATATPELETIVGTAGNDTYHVVRSGSQIHIHENKPPTGQPTYRAELAAMTSPLTIDAGAGNDSLTINSGGQSTLGLSLLNYAAGAGNNTLDLQSGSARVDSTATGGVLNTEVKLNAALTTARFLQNGLTLQNFARANILAGGTQPSVLTNISFASATPSSVLDLSDNELIFKPTPAEKVALFNILGNRLRAGYADGQWNGNGISSTTAAGNMNTTVGLVDNAVLGLSQFGGVAVDENSILLKYTYYGDIDLNGEVNADDLTVFANNFGRTGTASHIDGDVDFDFDVDADDLTVFANNFGRGVSAPLAAGPSDSVVARSPDRATSSTEGLLGFDATIETSAAAVVRGRETRAQHPSADEALFNLLAETIAAGSDRAQTGILTGRRLTTLRPPAAPGDFWATW
jgi:hypothetical protein